MKALILVLSARTPPWGALMDASLATWDAVPNEQTQTVYYCGNGPGMATLYPSGSVALYSQFSEALEEVSSRTIEAFEHALAIPGWDYIARPNSSCYVHKANLVACLETLPRTDILQGLLAFGDQGVGRQLLWGGGGFILSRDVVERLVEHRAAWRRDLMEDEALTRLAEVLAIPMGGGRQATIDLQPDGMHQCVLYGQGQSFSFLTYSTVAVLAAGHFFFRVKNDADRSMDVKVMHELHKVLP